MLSGLCYFLVLSELLNWSSFGRQFSLKPVKVDSGILLGLHGHLDLALIQVVIVDWKISASLSDQWPDFHHSSLLHCTQRGDLRNIHEGWLFFDPWGLKHMSLRAYSTFFPSPFSSLKILRTLRWEHFLSQLSRWSSFIFPLFLFFFFHILSEFLLVSSQCVL